MKKKIGHFVATILIVCMALEGCGTSNDGATYTDEVLAMPAEDTADGGTMVDVYEEQLENQSVGNYFDIGVSNEEFDDNIKFTEDENVNSSEDYYIELPVFSEQLKIAGYGVDDGDRMEEIRQEALKLMPSSTPGGYTGWICSNELSWNRRFNISYLEKEKMGGSSYITYISNEDEIEMSVSYCEGVQIEEYPLIESAIPLLTEYEEAMDALQIRDLVNMAKEKGKVMSDSRVQYFFNSQYGADTGCYITSLNTPLGTGTDITIELDVKWKQSFLIRFQDNKLVEIRVRKYINQQ